MSHKIYVGNLNYDTSEESLKDLFGQYGEVLSVAIITDKYTQRSKGFAFIEMAEADAAEAAISALNEQEIEGRRLRVNVAQEKPRRY